MTHKVARFVANTGDKIEEVKSKSAELQLYRVRAAECFLDAGLWGSACEQFSLAGRKEDLRRTIIMAAEQDEDGTGSLVSPNEIQLLRKFSDGVQPSKKWSDGKQGNLGSLAADNVGGGAAGVSNASSCSKARLESCLRGFLLTNPDATIANVFPQLSEEFPDVPRPRAKKILAEIRTKLADEGKAYAGPVLCGLLVGMKKIIFFFSL